MKQSDRKARFSRRRGSSSPRARRGATLVLVAILGTVLVGFAGIAIDFSRMYAFKAQLKTLTDAAALSAGTDLKRGATEAVADQNALTLIRANNRVEGSVLNDAGMSAADIEPIRWVTGSEPTTTSWANANGVRATARYTASWSLARIFGQSTRVLTESSVAALGSYVASACLAPFAIPYSALISRIPGTTTTVNDPLSASDLAYLAGNTAGFQLSEGGNPMSPGWFALVNYTDSNGNRNDVAAAIQDVLDGCLTGTRVSVGDQIDAVTGSGGWQSNVNLWRDLCNGNNQLRNCTRTIQVPIINEWNGRPGTNAAYTVNYVGAIQLTRIDLPNGQSSPAVVHASFTIDNVGGGTGFTPFPGMVQAIALVK